MIQKKKFISFTNLKHSKDKMVLQTSNSIVTSLRKESNVQSLMFTLKRLLRGLGGPKLRAGCFATLKWLISSMPKHIEFKFYENLVKKVLHSGANDPKNEKGDVSMGELLAYAIIINTDYLKQYQSDVCESIALKILNIGVRKSYLHYATFYNLSILFSKHHLDRVPSEIVDHLKTMDTNSLDKLHFILNLQPDLQSDIIKIAFNTKYTNLTDKKVMKLVIRLILKGPLNSFDHPCYELLIKTISTNLKHVMLFWSLLLDLIRIKEPKETTLALSMALLIIKHINNPDFVVDYLLEDKLIEIIKAKGRNQLVKNFLNNLNKQIENASDDLRIKVLIKFLFSANFINVEECTGSRVISQLISNLPLADIKSLAHQLKLVLEENFDGERGDKTYTFREKQTIFKYFSSLINKAETKNEHDWRLENLKFIIDAGVFVGIVPNINEKLSESFRNCLFNSVSSIHSNIVLSRELLVKLLQHILFRMENHRLRVKISQDDIKMFTKNSKWIISKVEANTDTSNITALLCAELLGLYIIINFFQHSEKSLVIFKDVRRIFMKIDDSFWTELLMNIIIVLLTESLACHRSFVNVIFKFALKYFNDNSRKTLTNLFYPNDTESDSENDDESESEDESESNEEKLLETECESVPKFVYDSRIIGEPSTSTQTDEAVPLPVPKSDSDEDMIDVDEMDEEDRKRLDAVLREAYLSRKDPVRKKECNDAMCHLRIRLLDLVEICCKQYIVLPFSFWLKLIPTLHTLFRSVENVEGQAPLHTKLRATMKKISGISFHKHYDVPSEEEAIELHDLIKLLLEDVIKGLQKDDKAVILNLTKSLLLQSNVYYKQNDQINFDRFTSLIFRYLKHFYEHRKIIPVTFFTSLCEANWEGMRSLINSTGMFTFNSHIRINRRLLGFKILVSFFSNDHYFGEETYSLTLRAFTNNFIKIDKDPNLFQKPDCLTKFIPKLKSFIKLLRVRKRDQLFNLSLFLEVINSLQSKAIEFRVGRNLPPQPQVKKDNVSRKRKRKEIKLMRI